MRFTLFPSSATPSTYGHEPARAKRLRRHRIAVGLLAAAASVAYLLFIASTGGTATEVQVLNPLGDDLMIPDGVELASLAAAPGASGIQVAPGRTVYHEDAAPDIADESNRDPTPQGQAGFRTQSTLRLDNLVFPLLPLALIAVGARALLARLGRPHQELNYGVYKGAMPFELHTRRWRRVHTWQRITLPRFARGTPQLDPPSAGDREDA